MVIRLSHFIRVMLVVLPVAASAIAGIYLMNEREVAAVEAAIDAKAMATIAALDRQVASDFAVLEALASVRSIEEGDIPRITDTLQRILTTQPGWLAIAVHDRTRFIAGTHAGVDPESPTAFDSAGIEDAFTTAARNTSGVFHGVGPGEPFYIARVPVFIGGRVQYVICAKVAAWTIHRTIVQFFAPESGRVSVMDRSAKTIARSGSTDARDPMVGTEPSLSVRKGILKAGTLFKATPNDGKGVYGIAKLHPETGWTVLVTMPQSVLDGPRMRMLEMSGLGTLIGAFIAAILAMVVSANHENRVQIAKKNAEAAADHECRIAAERLQNAFAAGQIGTYERDIETDTVVLDHRGRQILGFPEGEYLKLCHIEARVHPKDRSRVENALRKARDPEGDGIFHQDFRFLWANGTIRWVSMRGSVIFKDSCGHRNPCRFVSAVLDITDLKTAESALRQKEERLRLSAEVAGIGTFETDDTGHMRDMSAQMHEIFGIPEDQRINTITMLALTHPEDREKVAAFRFECRAPNGPDEADLQFRITRPDGAVRWLDMRVRVFRTEADKHQLSTRVIGVVRDVTERREAMAALSRTNADLEKVVEERTNQLLHSQKMEVIGRLTSGVAHNFNNVLQGVASCFGALERRIVDAHSRRLFDAAQQGIQRGARLTQHLLAFARRQSLSPKPTPMDGMLDSMRPILERSMGGLISIGIDVEDGTWPALVDPTQIELAILNLAINARDAMPLGGMLVLKARNVVVARQGEGHRPSELKPGEYVAICVSDNGCGMDKETQARVFEPFFTTKEIGKGSGLGLSMVHGMAVQSGGGVHIDSAPGAGTSVTIYLPRAEAMEQEDTVVAGDAPAVVIGGRVLIVDDDTLVRFGTTAVLTDAGYEVIEADSAYDALKFLRDGVAVDAMLTDYAMPGMNGAILVKEARQVAPSLPILMMTGYAERPEETEGIVILKKPFKPDGLLAAITSLVEAGQAKTDVKLKVA